MRLQSIGDLDPARPQVPLVYPRQRLSVA
jgi:hypothetical protein